VEGLKGLKEDQIEMKWKMNVSAWDLAVACKMPDMHMDISKDIPGVEGIEEHPHLCKALAFGIMSLPQLCSDYPYRSQWLGHAPLEWWHLFPWSC
jgi:hypothetical protein